MPRKPQTAKAAKPTQKSPTTPRPGVMLDLDGASPEAVPKLGQRPAYLLMVHPERWQVMHGLVVPTCGNLALIGGVNRVRKVLDPVTKKVRYLAKEAIAEMEERGWTVLPFAVDGESYLWEPLPETYLSRWETPHAGSEQVTVDELGFATWLRERIDAGDIPPPRPYVLERMAESLRHEIGDLSDRVRVVPSLRPTLERLQADLAAIETELENRGGAPIQPSGGVGASDLLGEGAGDESGEEE